MQKSCLILVLLMGMVLSGCGPSQRELAVARINKGKEILGQGDTLLAIQYLDSVRFLYPEARVQQKVAANMTDDLYRMLINDRIRQLKLTDTLISGLKQNFEQEKTEFDKYVQYISRRQLFSRSWNRSFLQVNLDERGELYLTSHYFGKEALNHTSVRIYDQGMQAVTGQVPVGDPDNRQSEFMGNQWEKVSYRSGRSDSVLQFIDHHRDLPLKCVFIGNRYYYILLEKYDIQAVVDALALSEALKKKQRLEAELKQFRSH